MPHTAPIHINASEHSHGKSRWERFRTFCLNAPVIVAKQHFFCCFLFPILSSFIGGSIGAALRTDRAEIIAGTVAVPLVTFGVMAAEQWWVDSRFHKHDDDDHIHDHNLLTWKRYLIQVAIGYVVFFIAHAILP